MDFETTTKENGICPTDAPGKLDRTASYFIGTLVQPLPVRLRDPFQISILINVFLEDIRSGLCT
jgi:hypothetical protein